MTRIPWQWLAVVVVVNCITQSPLRSECTSSRATSSLRSRPVTVGDMIEMTEPGEQLYVGGIYRKEKIAHFSPDGTRFLVVTKHGDVANDTNHYSLLLFDSKTLAATESQGANLFSMASSSNRPAIQQVTWRNNHAIDFLGENPGEQTQLYELDVTTRRLQRLTNHTSSLISYAFSPDRKRIAFLAEPSPIRPQKSDEARSGMVVGTQPLFGLLANRHIFAEDYLAQLFIRDQASSREDHIITSGPVVKWSPLAMSPDGHYLIVQTFFNGALPDEWKRYGDPDLTIAFEETRAAADEMGSAAVMQFQLVSIVTGQSRPLLEAPIPPHDHPDALWSPDSKSVALSMTYLPVDEQVHNPPVTYKDKFVTEIDINKNVVTPISNESMHIVRWDPASNKLVGNLGRWETGEIEEGKVVAFQKLGDQWEGATVPAAKSSFHREFDVTLEQGMNSPPTVVATDSGSGKTKVVCDLNPQFKGLRFGEVRDISFVDAKGISIRAGLYLPVGYQEGKQYPLIIQTHGWDPEKFWIGGPYTTASAAQAFAGSGFVVAQIAQNRSDRSTLKNMQGEMRSYEEVIEFLANRKMIDTKRMGIIGFSITGLGVKYALTHSKYHFVAATLSDTSDAGYFRYLAKINSSALETADSEGINGGIPIGDGIKSWLGNGLDFGFEKVSMPIRLEATSPESLLYTWESFGILKRTGKPVDYIFIPGGSHVLVKPWDRMISEKGNVDWFRFWLQGDEDPNPQDPDQYKRWEHLRELRDADAKATAQSQAGSPKSN